MSVETGVIGLPQSGRTTVFNALTGGAVDTSKHTQEGAAPHIGIAKIPDPRLQGLAAIFHPAKITPASATYIDIGASVKGLVQERGIAGKLLAQLSGVDALINVIRAFSDDRIPHVDGSINIERDIDNMDLELAFADLAILERKLVRIGDSMKGAKPSDRPSLLSEQALLMKIKAELEKDVPVRQLTLTPEEAKAIAGYQFLTAKPLLVVVNIGEDQLPQAASLEAELNQRYSQAKRRFITVCGKLEMELAQLDDKAAQELRAEFALTEPGVNRVIRLSYELLGLVSFLTAGEDDVRAWSIPVGITAVKAAGKIHSDLEKGFIRAEVISYDDLVKCGGLVEAKKQGLLRLEGKNYLVQDGDVITFLFNV